MGTFPDFKHVITVDKSATPTCQRLRPVPLARRQKAADEIDTMDRLGIWEPVEKSSWVHHMVTVPKADGGIRVTMTYHP